MKTIMAMILSVFMLVLVAGMASAVPPAGFTAISGTVYEANEITPVSGANVTVTCNGNVKTTTSSSTGAYGVLFLVSQCDVGDSVLVEAVKDTAEGSSEGTVTHEGTCLVNTGIIDVSIPEFGVIAGAVALVGALGIFVYRRKD